MVPSGQRVWIPAFAGMTRLSRFDLSLRHPDLIRGLAFYGAEEAGARVKPGVTGEGRKWTLPRAFVTP